MGVLTTFALVSYTAGFFLSVPAFYLLYGAGRSFSSDSWDIVHKIVGAVRKYGENT